MEKYERKGATHFQGSSIKYLGPVPVGNPFPPNGIVGGGGGGSFSGSLLNREELEDKFFRLKEEHLTLKKEANNAEHRVKFLNAKLSRLINEKKRLVASEKTKREVELEEMIYDLQNNVEQLRKENARLKEKCLVLKTQLSSGLLRNKMTTAYSSVRSRTDSGLTNVNYRITSANISSQHRRSSSTLSLNRVTFAHRQNEAQTRPTTASAFARIKPTDDSGTRKQTVYTSELLREAQNEIKRLEEVIVMQQNLMENLLMGEEANKCSGDSINSHLAISIKEHLMLNHEGTPHEAKGERPEEDREENDDNNDDSERGEGANSVVPQNPLSYLGAGKINKEIAAYVENLRKELIEEKNQSLKLRKQLISGSGFDSSATTELEQKLKQLERENQILRDSLENCIGSCLSDIDGKLEANKPHNGGTLPLQQAKELKDYTKRLKEENKALKEELEKEKAKVAHMSQECKDLESKLALIEKNNNEPSSGCTRIDHLQLSVQLKSMEKERENLLSEFSEMKQLLEVIQSNIQLMDPDSQEEANSNFDNG